MSKVQLSPAQAKVISREVEFSVHSRVDLYDKHFPSVEFKRGANNGGVTWIYTLTGPTVWVDKIEKRYAY